MQTQQEQATQQQLLSKYLPEQLVIAPQTRIAIVAYMLIIISMIIVYMRFKPNNIDMIQIIVTVVIALISIYAINCTVVGSCNTYAWIVTYIMVVMGVLTLLALMQMIQRSL